MRSWPGSFTALAVIALTIASPACSSTSAGVRSGQATSRPAPPDSGGGSGSSGTTAEPQSTDSTQPTEPQETDSTESTDPTDVDETVGPPPEPTAPAAPIGVGDDLFPDLGSPVIDVTHYEVDLSYDPDTTLIDATVAMSIMATDQLHEFTLDAVGLDVDHVVVDGFESSFAVVDPELIIDVDRTISAGESFDVTIDYETHGNGDQIAAGRTAGWFVTQAGSFTLNEPDGARTWLPSNDHPSDKATYRFTLHVPTGLTAVANGRLEHRGSDESGDIWVWDNPEPTATYLLQVLTGPFEIVEGTGPAGLPLVSALQRGDEELMQPVLDMTAEQIDYFDDFFGPYPFDSYGVAMTDGSIGGAMEEQTRSLFSRDDFAFDPAGVEQQVLLSHELSHQWFGDAVTPADWHDVWLNESFATYGQWMWLEHTGFGTVAENAEASLGTRSRGDWDATGRPAADNLFGFEVYEGGAVVLQALRLSAGDDAFFEILRRWVQDNIGASKTSQDFIELTSEVTGQDYAQFFDEWLYSADIPDSFPG